MKHNQFRIHGDNIVECHRTLDLLVAAFECKNDDIAGPYGSAIAPTYRLKTSHNGQLSFQFFPGYGRWNQDILTLILSKGGILREAADAIITKVLPFDEIPLVAIEYCGALPAGNQAWQRSGRPYSFARAGIPFLYVAELGGYELDENRARKASRFPNPAVPFSYISYSISQSIPILPVFVENPGASDADKQHYAEVFGNRELTSFMGAIISENHTNNEQTALLKKALILVQKLASSRRGNDSLSGPQWQKLKEWLESGNDLSSFMATNAKQDWEKTAYIDGLTETASKLMSMVSHIAVGMTSANLPLCIVPSENRQQLYEIITALYGEVSSEYREWLLVKKPLAICWIMGFKPRGDDARPDRGLPPLARMLGGEKVDLLTVVYGPAPRATWGTLDKYPGRLATQNGLWEVILQTSDALIVDSSTDNIKKRTYTKSHWKNQLTKYSKPSLPVDEMPSRTTEHDVDTVLHTFFTSDRANVYEGMCNPPGGDWSGVSLLTKDRDIEVRWLTLPRVSGELSKRPDHVIQIFGLGTNPIVLSIESKTLYSEVEPEIGKRLNRYIQDLVATTPSIERTYGTMGWKHAVDEIDVQRIQFASGAAFMASSTFEVERVAKTSGCDIAIGVRFRENGRKCDLMTMSNSSIGAQINRYIEQRVRNHPIFTCHAQ